PPPPATATYTLSLHDALPIYRGGGDPHPTLRPAARAGRHRCGDRPGARALDGGGRVRRAAARAPCTRIQPRCRATGDQPGVLRLDRKSTRLNSSHEWISYAVF